MTLASETKVAAVFCSFRDGVFGKAGPVILFCRFSPTADDIIRKVGAAAAEVLFLSPSLERGGGVWLLGCLKKS